MCTRPRTFCSRSFDGSGGGGEVSDRPWRDILGIVRVQTDRLDRDYLERTAVLIEVVDLLRRAMDEGSVDLNA